MSFIVICKMSLPINHSLSSEAYQINTFVRVHVVVGISNIVIRLSLWPLGAIAAASVKSASSKLGHIKIYF